MKLAENQGNTAEAKTKRKHHTEHRTTNNEYAEMENNRRQINQSKYEYVNNDVACIKGGNEENKNKRKIYVQLKSASLNEYETKRRSVV